jgi:hypothetical protein
MSATVYAALQSISEVGAAIASGQSLFLAGSRQALSCLPKGNWIGGTTSYFMTEEGGQVSEDRIFVSPIPECALGAKAADYGPAEIARIYRDAPEHGFTFLVVPASTEVHKNFAEQAPACGGFLFRPVVGWVAGVRVDRIGQDAPAVFNGRSGAVLENRCAALHVALPANKVADIDIVNIFESGGGAVVRFEEAGFTAGRCWIDGEPANLADHIVSRGIPTESPLVGDYNGTAINVSFQKLDAPARTVEFYAPVFPGVDYRFAKPVENYERAFALQTAAGNSDPDFACNCILNFLYGCLEGKNTGNIVGPITFGEIAHQLLNQTLVRLYLRDIG